jgi:hypothetical protein
LPSLVSRLILYLSGYPFRGYYLARRLPKMI